MSLLWSFMISTQKVLHFLVENNFINVGIACDLDQTPFELTSKSIGFIVDSWGVFSPVKCQGHDAAPKCFPVICWKQFVSMHEASHLNVPDIFKSAVLCNSDIYIILYQQLEFELHFYILHSGPPFWKSWIFPGKGVKYIAYEHYRWVCIFYLVFAR